VKNHFKNIVSLLGAAIFMAGCATPPDVATYRNPITNEETDLLSENELVTPGTPREIIWLNAARLPVNGQWKIYLEVMYGANKEAGYLEIYPGRTLSIIADGKELKFGGLGSLEKHEKNNVVYETARYEATLNDIDTIANAKKVTVLVQGKDALIEREFAPENFARFRQFSQKLHNPPQAAVAPMTKMGY
jgi:hypothetical protein